MTTAQLREWGIFRVDYLQLYKEGLVSLTEAYVLARNKLILLNDFSMHRMIFDIEKVIIEETINVGIIEVALCFESVILIYMHIHGYRYDDYVSHTFVPDINY